MNKLKIVSLALALAISSPAFAGYGGWHGGGGGWHGGYGHGGYGHNGGWHSGHGGGHWGGGGMWIPGIVGGAILGGGLYEGYRTYHHHRCPYGYYLEENGVCYPE